MKELTYNLRDPFEYAFKGDMREAAFITVSAPTVENIGCVARLKQGFMQAVSNQKSSSSEAAPKDEDAAGMDDLSGDMIMAMLSMSDIDYAGYLTTARAVFSDTGVALIDGEEPIKKAVMSKMSMSDLEAMTGEYLKVFILTSALEMM
jgi:hypothetical protein